MISVTANLTPEKFLKIAGPWLEAEEDRNNSILGTALAIAGKPSDQRPEHYFWVVQKDKNTVGAAFLTPPFKLSLARMDAEALAALVKKIRKTNPVIPGVIGPQEIMPSFIRAWNLPGLQAELDMSARLYKVEKVEQVPPAPGSMRQALPQDLDLLTQWTTQFREEIKAPEKIEERELVDRYIREGRLLVWGQGGSCFAMAGTAGITPNGARINMVFTPRGLRKRGYATNLVAALSQQLLNSGKKFCVLYTDLLNPTSNAIYQKIGFKPVGDWDGYSFQEFKSLFEGE